MARDNNATPLIALHAMVIDSETTGLDPVKARIIEFGAVPLNHGKLDETKTTRLLINPGIPIPEESTHVHKINDADVAAASRFAQAWPELSELLAKPVVIGHSVGFDLAVLRHECARAGIKWRAPRTLDTRLLAQVVQPHLSGYSIEHLASWLGVTVEGRHAAVSDAIITAKIFLALIPKLREGNIRTLAEAEQACLMLSNLLDDQHRAGWEATVQSPASREMRTFSRIDIYPYRHCIAEVMSAPAKTISADEPLTTALKRMAVGKISSLLTVSDDGAPFRAGNTGIITERDVMRALTDRGPAALTMPVGQFASKPLITLPSTAFVYRALGRMSRLGFRHLGVENENGEICGLVTSRDLLRLRAQEATMLGDGIDNTDDVPALGAAWAQLPRVAQALIDEGVSGRDIAAVISQELCALTRRVGIFAERRMIAEGHGAPPCAFSLCVLGSAGRGESLLAMDQDNALVFAEGEPGGAADVWFARYGDIVADILHEVGVPYCKGGVMAKNPQWRGSVATWKARVDDWIKRSKPADLLSVDIFFDLVSVHGDGRLANDIWRAGFAAARGQTAFAKLLANGAGETGSWLTIFGGIRAEQGRIDLKKAGLFGIVTMARVLAVRYHLLERSTPARLSAAAALGRGGDDLDAAERAQALFLNLIVRQQVADIYAGLPPSNKVAIKRLTDHERARLKSALSSISHLIQVTHDLLF